MKTRFNPFLALAFSFAASTGLPAAVLYWDGADTTADANGGAGLWNTIATNWDDAATAGASVAWPAVSTGDDDAVFGSAGGTVTVDAAGVTANDLTFGVTGYILDGGSITLGGATNNLVASPNSNNVATVSAPIASTTGFTKSGSGLLTLSGANTLLAGAITVGNPPVATNNGGLVLSGASATGTVSTFNVNGSNSPTADGGWLGLANGAAIASGATINLSGQGGNSAPPGTLRTTAGSATVDGNINILTNNVRISCSGSTGSELRINGQISDGANSFGISFRFGDGNGVYLTNTGNAWDGDTINGQGTLRAEPGAIPANSRIIVGASSSGWFQTYGTLTRSLGTTSGTGVIDMSSNAANKIVGVAARGGDLSVNFGGAGADVVWASTTGFNPAILGLNSPTSDSAITLINPLDLNGGARGIDVGANTAVLQGGIKNTSATAASLRKTGIGTLSYDPGVSSTLTLAGLNTSGGTMELKSGTYIISGTAGTSAPTGTTGFIVATGGTFRLNGANVSATGGSYVFPAGNTAGGNSNFILDAGTFDAGAKEALNAYGANGTTTINGGTFICGTFRVAQSGGNLHLNGGTLRASGLTHGGGTSSVYFNGGTLQAKANNTAFIATGVVNASIKSGGAVIDSNGFNISIPKPLAEDAGSTGGGLTKKGGGVLDLTAAANTHTGENLIQGGVLRISDNAQLGTAAATVTVNGGQFGVAGTAIGSITSLGRSFTYITGGFNVGDAAHILNVDIPITGTAGLSKSGAGTISLTGANDFTGNISGASGDCGWIDVDSSTDLGTGVKTADYSASGSGGLGGIKLSGNVTVSDVTLNIAGRNVNAETQHVLWNVSGNNKWTGGVNITSTGGTYYLRSDAGTLELAGNLGNIQLESLTSDTRAYNLQGPGNFLISGAIVNGINANRFVALNVNGAGTATLTGTNTYTGPTAVNDGVLLVNGDSSAATGAVSVNGDGILGGNGTVGGAITVSTAAKLAPGASAGTLTTSANVGGDGTLAIELDGAAADKLALTGSGVIDISALKLDVTTLVGGASQAVYVIVDSASAITGAAFGSVTGVPSGYNLVYNYNDGVDANNIALVSGAADPFTSWASTTHGLAGGDAAATADPDNDGLDNAVEFVLGGQPNPANPNASSSALAPVSTVDPSNLVFSYRRSDLSMTQPGIAISVQYGSDLTGWTTAVHGTNGVSISVTNDGFGSGVDRVDVSIPRALAVGSKLFGRLNVVIP